MMHVKTLLSTPPCEEKNSATSDEALLEASRTDSARFEVLVRRYQAKLFRAALRVVQDVGYAEDVVQEAFIKMYRHANSFSGDTGTFHAWAYAITINCAKTYYRQLKRNVWEDIVPLEDTGYDYVDDSASNILVVSDDHERTLEIYEMRKKIEQLLKKIPRHLRIVLEKYYLEGKSYREICKEEGIPASSLKMRLFRARNLLRDRQNVSNKEQAEIV